MRLFHFLRSSRVYRQALIVALAIVGAASSVASAQAKPMTITSFNGMTFDGVSTDEYCGWKRRRLRVVDGKELPSQFYRYQQRLGVSLRVAVVWQLLHRRNEFQWCAWHARDWAVDDDHVDPKVPNDTSVLAVAGLSVALKQPPPATRTTRLREQSIPRVSRRLRRGIPTR